MLLLHWSFKYSSKASSYNLFLKLLQSELLYKRAFQKINVQHVNMHMQHRELSVIASHIQFSGVLLLGIPKNGF